MDKNSMSFLRLNQKLKKVGIELTFEGNLVEIFVYQGSINIQGAKDILFKLINKFADYFFVVIKGIPYCVIPEAAHYVLYEKRQGERYYKTQACAKCSFFENCHGIKEISENDKNKSLFKPHPVKDRPSEIILEVTKKCNLNCPLCFVRQEKDIMSIERIKEIVDECVSLGINEIRFSGGEPLLYDPIEEAVSYAKQKGLYVTLNTNATVLNSSNRRVIKKYVDNLLIPLQGFDPRSERKLANADVDFEKKVKNIIALSRIVPLVRVGTIISRTLMENMRKYLYLIKKMNIRYWELYRPLSDPKKTTKEFNINKKELLKLLDYMFLIREKREINLRILNPVPFCINEDLERNCNLLYGSEKDDGHSRLVLDGKGFKPSYAIRKNLGFNILEAWNNPFLKKVRGLSYLDKKCKKCSYLKWCKGGSRAMSYFSGENYFGKDPLMP